VSVSTQERFLPALARESRQGTGGWLVGPWFDLLFIANLSWPLVLLAPVGESFGGHTGLQFWQLYYITTPHRWITLLIVFLDRERFAQRKLAFLTLAAAIATACLAVRLTTGALTCLLAIDYVWNAWHFASQHHGIYRIYGRLGEAAPPPGLALEKWAMRSFLLYVILRVVSATWSDASWDAALRACDWIAALVPAGLIARNVFQLGRSAVLSTQYSVLSTEYSAAGRIIYLVSVSGLYLSLLWAVHVHRPGLVLSLATASALFHAVEYLALVTWATRARHSSLGEKMGLLGYFAPRWGIALAVFVLVLGAGGWLLDTRFVEFWLLINVIVAFLHYAYDGMIWRRRPASATT
jgi:hypothetical protein